MSNRYVRLSEGAVVVKCYSIDCFSTPILNISGGGAVCSELVGLSKSTVNKHKDYKHETMWGNALPPS